MEPGVRGRESWQLLLCVRSQIYSQICPDLIRLVIYEGNLRS